MSLPDPSTRWWNGAIEPPRAAAPSAPPGAARPTRGSGRTAAARARRSCGGPVLEAQ